MGKVWKQSLWPFFLLGLVGSLVVDNLTEGAGMRSISAAQITTLYEEVATATAKLKLGLLPMISRVKFDASQIEKVETTSNEKEVNRLLEEGFILMAVAAGVNELGQPYNLYSLGLAR